MDNWASWAIAAFGMIAAAAWCVRYTIAEYEKYLYNRQHGWQ